MNFVLPLLDWLPFSTHDIVALVGRPTIFGTVAVECAVPVLLLIPRTRLVGCFLGLLFHLPMMAQGLMDFPVIVLAFYPLFLGLETAQAVFKRLLSRPSMAHITSTLVIGSAGIAAIWSSRRVDRFYDDSAGFDPVVGTPHFILLCLTFVAAGYVVSLLAVMLAERKSVEHSHVSD
jgi:hypothetical protein